MKKKTIKFIITFCFLAYSSYVNAQGTLSDIENHFDSVCVNCNYAESAQIIYKACKEQDSLISRKKKLLLLLLKKRRHYSEYDSMYISIVSGFDKLVEIENKNKKNVIAVFRSLFSGSMLSSQAGIITYYFNEQTIDLLEFYIENNTE